MDYTFTKDDILFEKTNCQIRNIIEDYKAGIIDLNPWFQRDFKNKIKSSIIESILLKFPISQIYLMEYKKDGKTKSYVVDGKQRLATIISFHEGFMFDKELNRTEKKFKCKNFEVLKELNNKTYGQFTDDQIKSFREYELSIIKITIPDSKNSDANENIIQILSYVFEKVNSTSKALTKTEIWNAIYHGPLFDGLKKIWDDKNCGVLDWFPEKQIDKDKFFSIMLPIICMISGSFNNKSLSNSIQIMLEEKANDEIFCSKMLENVRKIFKQGRELFNLKKILSGRFPKMRKQLMVSYFKFIKFQSQFLPLKEQIDNSFELLFNSEEWAKYASTWTTKNENIWGRIRLIDNVFFEIIQKNNLYIDGKRFFSNDVKIKLWNTNEHICNICGQKIENISDAHVDHIIPWSLGGKTDISNAQLAHRTCNISKSNKI